MAYEQESPLINGTSNNTLSQADALTSGVKMVAALDSSSDIDFFQIGTSGPSLITLDFLSPLLTTSTHWQVRLLDPSGDYVRTLASSVQGTPLVNGASQSGSTLVVDGLSSAPPAGSKFTFVTAQADTTVYRVVSATAQGGGGYSLSLDKALPAGLSDNTALAFDPAQILTGVTSSLTAAVSAAGNYAVQVLADGGVWNSADYGLSATVTPTVEKEGTSGNDNKTDAADAGNRLLANIGMTGSLSSATDVDYWVFTTAKPSDFTLSFASSSQAPSPEWKIDITPWSGVPLSGGSLSASASASYSVAASAFPAAQTFMVAVSAVSSTAYNGAKYTLKVGGAGLDLNDAPVLSVGTVSVRVPEPGVVVDTQVVRNVSAGSTTGVRLDSLFSVTDPDAASSGQSVSYYRLSLTKEADVTSDASIQVQSGGEAKTYGLAASGSVTLTAAEMATAVFLPGTTAAGGSLKLALQAYDSTSTLTDLGGQDGSGASAILQQTLKIVSGSVGVSVNSTNTPTTLSENALGEGSGKPASGSFTVALSQAPTADVKVFLTDVNNQLDFSTGVLTFTSANYATAQTVTVTATADGKNEGASQAARLTFQVVSQDSSFDGFLVAPLNFSVADNAAPVLATPTAINYTDTVAEDSFSTPTSGSLTGTLSATDANGDSLSYGILGGTQTGTTVSQTNAFGTLTVTTASGAYSFSPAPDALDAAASAVSAEFIVTASDGTTTSNKSLTINVAGVNDKPILEFADPSPILVERGGEGNDLSGTSTGTLSLDLFDAEGAATLDTAGLLALGWVTANEGVTYTKTGNFGTATLNTGTLTLSYGLDDNHPNTQGLAGGEPPDEDADTFRVQVKDAQGLTGVADAVFEIQGSNDWPVFTPMPDQIIGSGQALSLTYQGKLVDPDSDLTITAKLAGGEALPAWLSFDANSGAFSGTPSISDLATLSILVTASDGAGGTAFDNFELTVADADQTVVLRADTQSGGEDSPAITGNVLSNDRAPAGTTLTVVTYSVPGVEAVDAGTSITLAGQGSLRVNSDGGYSFTPVLNFNGALPVITYDTSEGISSTLAITVTAQDDVSVTQADSKTGVEGSAVSGDVLSNDSDVDNSLSVARFTLAGNSTVFNAGQTATLANQGSLLLQIDGSYVFTPLTDFSGALPLVSYTLNTGAGSTLAINLTPVNDPPTGGVTISGTPTQGQVLTATNTLADVDGLGNLSYVWKAAGLAVSGATNASFRLGLSQVGKAISVEVKYTDGGGTAESVSSSATSAVAADVTAPTGVNVEVQAYAWKSHVLLNDVQLSLNGSAASQTSGQGKSLYTEVMDLNSLSASRSATDTASANAVNLQDAIAILKLVVGLPVNGANQALSPYQALAADYNGNGSVELSDAIDVLKYVVGLPGTQPSWKFLNETTPVASLTADPTHPGLLPALAVPTGSPAADVRVGLVGLLRGDVDGSYAGAANADVLSNSYFTELASAQQLNASQFGIYS